jgi:hypothetical protein
MSFWPYRAENTRKDSRWLLQLSGLQRVNDFLTPQYAAMTYKKFNKNFIFKLLQYKNPILMTILG